MRACVPLGDQGALCYFATEEEALRFAKEVRGLSLEWVIDVVSSYFTVAVFCDAFDFEELSHRLRQIEGEQTVPASLGRRYVIPCCYERGLDLDRVAAFTCQSRDDVIKLHQQTEYVVYAIGFCPGFPYLGYLPPELVGVPRLDSPRFRVEAGSVGLTGKQTGIYTLPRPGGWNIIGQTPLELVNIADAYFPLKPGDLVCFRRIDDKEFDRLKGERL
ncbi:MAG: allophanate hydrolase [Gemmatales bacterium]|nr:MAG: allophanate hydrolase [Gemmatales bacterium]